MLESSKEAIQMTTVNHAKVMHQQKPLDDTPQGNLRFDGLIAILSLWLVLGMMLDGWAHNSLDTIETFFTPWHAVLYSGLGVNAIALVGTWLVNQRKGYAWTHALPAGYMLSLLGILIFGFAGVFDFTWHKVFGFEVDTEALLSPPHLMLATGGLLVVSGPLRAAWRSGSTDTQTGWRRLWPIMLSAFAILCIFTFFTQFSNGFQHANTFTVNGPQGDPYFWQVATISYVLIPAAILMAFVLFLIRHWTLPQGGLFLLIAGNSLLMFLMGSSYSIEQWPVLIAAVAGGILAEVLYAALRPSIQRVQALRLFAFTVPVMLYLLYFTALIAAGGIWWRIHLWLGAPLLAGGIGLGLSFLLAPTIVKQG
jgi:hypothetical protein